MRGMGVEFGQECCGHVTIVYRLWLYGNICNRDMHGELLLRMNEGISLRAGPLQINLKSSLRRADKTNFA